MRIFIAAIALLCLPGCVGLGVGAYGTFETKVTKFQISDKRNEFGYSPEVITYTKEQLISMWGKPDENSKFKSCEVVTYYDGYSWSGVGAFVVIIPIPILVPSGQDENRFYFRDGKSVGLVKEYGEVTGAFGYMCGSNECDFIAGAANTNQTRQATFNWCD